MATNPIKSNELIEDKVFQPTIDNGLALLNVLQLLVKEMQKIAAASKGKITNIDASNYEGIKGLGEEYQKATKIVTEHDKTLKQIEVTKEKIANATSKETQELVDLKLQLDIANKANKENVKINSDTTDAYEKLDLKLKQARKSYRDLAAQGLSNTEQAKKFKVTIDNLDASLKKIDADMGIHTRKVGQYENATKNLLPILQQHGGIMGRMLGQLQSTKDSLSNYIATQRGAAVATGTGTKAMQMFRIALAATGIGLIVIALGLLIAAFSKFNPFIEKFQQIMAGIGAAVDVVINRIIKMGAGLMNILSGNFKEGFKQIGDAAKGMGDEMVAAAKAAAKLKKELQDIEDEELSVRLLRAKVNADNALRVKEIKNRKLSYDEKKKLAEEAIKDESDIYKKEQELLNRRFENSVKTLALAKGLTEEQTELLRTGNKEFLDNLDNFGQGADAEVEAFEDAFIAIQQSREASEAQQQKLQNFYDAADEQEKERREKAAEARKKAAEKRQAELELEYKLQLEITNAHTANIKNEYDKQVQQILNAFNEKKKELYKEYEGKKELNKLLIELEESLNKEIEAVRKKEVDDKIAAKRKEIDDEKKFRTEMNNAIKKGITEAATIEENSIEMSEMTEKEKQKAILEIKKKAIQDQLNLVDNLSKLERSALERQLYELNKQSIELETSTRKEKGKKQVEDANRVEQMITNSNKRKNDLQNKSIENEIKNNKKRQDQLREQAQKGVLDANNSLAFEQRREAELEQKKEKLAKKQQRQQFITNGLKAYSANAEKDPKTALSNTIKDIAALAGALRSIPGFIEGTDNVAASLGKPQFKGKDGYLIRVDGDEGILNPELNKRKERLGFTNKSLIEFAEQNLINPNQFDNMPIVAAYNDNLSGKKLDELNVNLKSLLKVTENKPTHQFEYDHVKKAIIDVVYEGSKITRTESKNKGGRHA